jgi:hypothetical protein
VGGPPHLGASRAGRPCGGHRRRPCAGEVIAAAAETTEGVWVSDPAEDGLTDIHIRTDAASAIEFNDAVDQVAAGLAELGDTDGRTVRRAKAVGILAHPQQALDIFSRMEGSGSARTRQAATLYLHTTIDAWQSGCGVVRAEGIGPITVGQAQRWLQHRQVTVRAVLDPDSVAPVDAYELPDRMREAVRVLMPADTFPFASSTGRRLDIDHTVPYRPPDDGDPPGRPGSAILLR